ncbi:thiol S-methyltransferase TMT1A-like [Ptychodera flava]|uniref:thiol S-methyltransferase TMT1A-like n=1 Tax=Ptychodera flava TaxID=63121 RepID=UPI00396A0B2C
MYDLSLVVAVLAQSWQAKLQGFIILGCIAVVVVVVNVVKLLRLCIPPVMDDSFCNWYNGKMVAVRRKLLSNLKDFQAKTARELTVLEVGVGGCGDFIYLPKGTRVIGVLENGEDLKKVSNNSVDTVVSTLVMCKVRDPTDYVREVKRVLKPGGMFCYMENVQSRERKTRIVQNLLSPLSIFFVSYRLTRQTWRYVDVGGFDLLEYSIIRAPLKRCLSIFSPHLVGYAVKR